MGLELADMNAAWEREAHMTAKRQTPQEACRTTLARSRRSLNNQNLTNILCVKMLRENGVPSADLSGMDGDF